MQEVAGSSPAATTISNFSILFHFFLSFTFNTINWTRYP